MPPASSASPDSPRVALLVETSTTWARSILDGINRYLRKGDYWQIFLEPHGSNESIRMPAGWVGEGVIADIKDMAMARQLHALDIPVVNISQLTFPGLAFPTVTTDISACLRMAAEYYFERGYENLGYLRLDRNAFDGNMSREFGHFVQHAGGRFFPKSVKNRAWGVADWNVSIRELAGWLRELPKPVGLFSWAIGREVIHAVHLAGLRIPEEVALVMLSDDEIFLEMSHVPMSGITHPGAEIGHEAAQMLADLMAAKATAAPPAGTPVKKRSAGPVRQSRPSAPPPVRLIKPLGIRTRQSSDVLAITDPALRAAIGYVRQHAGEPLQVDDLARHAGVSRRTLEQKFAQTLERSPAEYIRDTHLGRARELLRETTLPIPQVADASGFSSPEYMAQLFRARLGVSPLRYRRQVSAR
ncbi:transcriptional regulator containing an amidase domain and an AraC-type DNA-binding HTH domain [Opitutaceae bacterium TAV1]|nr:transcriptional regulator containing an amidase domain and an AraC-type DNA-binding HTH domain [Opitutaceae bacterium TAV1]